MYQRKSQLNYQKKKASEISFEEKNFWAMELDYPGSLSPSGDSSIFVSGGLFHPLDTLVTLPVHTSAYPQPIF